MTSGIPGVPGSAMGRIRGPAFVAQVRAERMTNHVAGLACSLRGMGAGAMDPLWDDLARVTFPCTFVAGQLDHGYVSSARRLAATVPNGRVEVVPRAGHTVHLERPDAFARVLDDHLARATSGVTTPERSEEPAGDDWPSTSTSA